MTIGSTVSNALATSINKHPTSLFFFTAIFLLDKIEMPAPNKLIKQEIGNDKLITVK